jgi:outer membrane protein insertion porin family
MKGTKEMTKLTLFPDRDSSKFGVNPPTSFKKYVEDAGFLSMSKTKDFLDPYFRFKLFSSAKFNDK